MHRPDATGPIETEHGMIVPITPELIREMRLAREVVEEDDPVGRLVAEPQEYRIGPADILSITVWGHPELTIPAGEFRDAALQGYLVRDDGTLFYPYVGVITVAGKTISQVRAELTRRLAPYLNDPQLDVRVIDHRSQRAYVAGEVREPGVRTVTDVPLTVLEAISASGGLTPEADPRNATLTRDGEVIRLDLLALYESGDRAQNVLMRAGDVLNVPDRSSQKIFVMGEVTRPSSVEIPRRGITLAEALSDVGGPNQLSANPGRIYVIRAGVEEIPDVFHLDARSASGMMLAERFELRPRDVVYVDAAGLTRWNRFLTQILPSIGAVVAADRVLD
ncbi:hypothetical protein CAI21_17125 [Alkalilimnicola ehrlichii]|uniref:Polysaccharide export protein n=2 Tax=Alkalilimnicola ehrlichii TaxID=351052 RepID=A0A3E0WM38_9GAMM|nr:hypothetical protein CAI21_17125 [Alkalilimnicola ehrlichii]RFA33479.1 hypothetical protein CAL65_17600 [Alkalilimnicola ehrlichii]